MNTLLKGNSIFEQYYLDFDLASSKAKLIERLNKEGLVTFDGIESSNQLLSISNELGKIFMHRDSDANGITHVVNKKTYNQKAGYQGLTSHSLKLHTDRSSIANPPEILVFYCKRQAEQGGESILMDGKVLYDTLKNEYPAILEEISKPNAILYGSDGNYFSGSIFDELSSNNNIRMRFRYDSLGFYTSSIISKLPVFLELIDRHSFSFTLKENQGYIIRNDRWLHGRNEFIGEREMYRILVNINKEINDQLQPGFNPY
jgi:alpha-ketoglutarate-dependent taurine dioxygenase